jgi:Cyclic nucleotide-binding domain
MAGRLDPSLNALLLQEPAMANKTPLAFSSPDLFKRVDTQTTTQDYRNKQSIFAQGDKAYAMFYIRKGTVKLPVASKTGKKAIVAMLKAGEFFGEGCLARQSMRVFTATAIQSSAIARIKRSDLVRILHQEPAFLRNSLFHISYFVLGESRRSLWIKSSVQRKKIGKGPVTLVWLWIAIKHEGYPPEGEPGNTCRNGWYYSVQSKLLYEPITGTRIYYL